MIFSTTSGVNYDIRLLLIKILDSFRMDCENFKTVNSRGNPKSNFAYYKRKWIGLKQNNYMYAKF